MVKCPVCQMRVDENGNVISEHEAEGMICYGSFMPVTEEMKVRFIPRINDLLRKDYWWDNEE